LAVLRTLEDHLLRDARNSVTAVTTAEVALYILNNKRAFVTDMERRYGIVISVQASDRMQGANFAIERSAVQAPAQKAPERSAVNMDWGFDGQDAEEDAAEEEAGAAAEGEGGGRRRRRRRRGRRDDRPEAGFDRPGRHERPQHAENGEGGEFDFAREPGQQSAEDGQEDGGELPAGFGEQPSIAQGGEDRPGGRRRRRGRRGGRRGRDRDAPRQLPDDLVAHEGAEADDLDALEPEPLEDAPTTRAAESEPSDVPLQRPEAVEPEPAHAAAGGAEAPTRSSWQGGGPDTIASPQAEAGHRVGQEAVTAPPPELAREPQPSPAPVHVSPVEEDAGRPARKGWWQRRLLGE
jgi:ribonuclease E